MRIKKTIQTPKPLIRTGLLSGAIVLVIILLLLFYKGGLEEIIAVLIGFLVAKLVECVVTIISIIFEDRQKLSENELYDYYDSEYYLKTLHIGDAFVKFWYHPLLRHDDNIHYRIIDDVNVTYSLPDIIENNICEIMEAHKGSELSNMRMIRLDNYEDDQSESQRMVTLYTSRTIFYYDLLTNRAMDYDFKNGMTVRKLFECDQYLNELKNSRMSNHIGINAIVFIDDSMLVAHRSGDATMSKNQAVSSIAMGLSVDDLRRVSDVKNVHTISLKSMDDLNEVVKSKTTDLIRATSDDNLRSAQIESFFLGFGQLVSTGGKPQFYYAVVVSTDKSARVSGFEHRLSKVDANKSILKVTDIKLSKDGSKEIVFKLENGKQKTLEAEESFFANLYHLKESENEGIPSWIRQRLI